jgi:predicted MPP superfamily phosphohydrolase
VKRWLERVAIGMGVTIVLLLVYGTAVEPRFILDEERWRVAVPELGEAWAETEVALVSDWQIGMWWSNEDMIERAVEEILAEEPDVILLAGDFVYSTEPDIPTQVENVLDLATPLIESGIPVYAVLGNHDYAVNAAEELTQALEDAGIPVLHNEALPVPSPAGTEERLYVVGLGPAVPDEVDIRAALRDVSDDAARVVLMHNPTVFDRLPADTAPLAVAGHTHCGQVALPGKPRWSYIALTQEEKVVADGWAPPHYGADGNRLYVTCGIGFSTFPIRLNAPPEVTFFELVPGRAGE